MWRDNETSEERDYMSYEWLKREGLKPKGTRGNQDGISMVITCVANAKMGLLYWIGKGGKDDECQGSFLIVWLCLMGDFLPLVPSWEPEKY